MKNILYLGPYRQKDGWGQASHNYLQSIMYATQKMGYNLKIAPVYFTGQVWESLKDNEDENPQLKQYEDADIYQFDTIIQKGLPESLCWVKDCNNVCITVLETQNIQHTKNKHILNRFNHILVPSEIEKQTLEFAGIKSNISSILEPINCQEIDEYKHNNSPLSSKYDSYVKYYFIGEFIARKNIIDLMIAFSLAFRSTDKAVLFIKTSSTVSIDSINNIINTQMKALKNASANKNIVFINKRLPRQEILNLHNMCDIFVCPSQGEAFCIPLAEGMRFGNIPIVVQNTGPTSFVNDDNGYIIPSRPEVCTTDAGSATLDSYCSNETWMRPTVYDMVQILRKSYYDFKNSPKFILEKKQCAYNTTNNFTFSSIGEKICSLGIM